MKRKNMEQIELRNTDNLAITLLPKADRKSLATLQDIMDLQDIKESQFPLNAIFEKKVVEGESVGLTGLMGLDYSEYPGFSEFLLSLVHKYELFYLSKKQNPEKCVWEVFEAEGINKFRRAVRYDCFNFIWLVFSNFIEQEILPNDLEARIAGKFRTVDIVKEAIAKNILFELGDFTQFTKKSGFIPNPTKF